jgi:hypothetical protein
LIWGGVLVLAGLPIYFWQRRQRLLPSQNP